MAIATVDGQSLSFETIGEGAPWMMTLGGRFSLYAPGVREAVRRTRS
jgi:hypothetical protein